MNEGTIQYLLEQLALTSRQRWCLIGLAVLSMTGGSAVAMIVGGDLQLAVVAPIVLLAMFATLRADSHTALAVEVLLLWQWFISAEDPATPWAIAMAGCVLVFHATIALMAVTPISATVDRDVIRAWVTRGAALIAATVAVWSLVAVFDRADYVGGALITVAALVALGILAVVARWRLEGSRPAESR